MRVCYRLLQCLGQLLRVTWALPATRLGMIVGLLGVLTGGRMQAHHGIVEFSGGVVTWLLRHGPPLVGGAAAMTLGHVVLGVDEGALDYCRSHELVHVRQYERWGPLFIPAYLLCSLVCYCQGRDGYFDNPFEREAYNRDAEQLS